MTPHREPNQSSYEQPSNAYGIYEGNMASTQQQYEIPYQQPPQQGKLDDNLVEAVSQRVAQLISQQSMSKAYQKSQEPIYGMRLALGIISLLVVIPLAGICLAGLGGVVGLIGFLIGCTAIIWINLAFNGVLGFRHRGGLVK